ncbi:MAG: hypothetical protein K2G78_03675 [Muribaculaceae bacterium]|nr:hypothetical protein [Muribaculaceae bacterium]
MRRLLHRFGIRILTASIAMGAGLACAGLAAAQEPQSEPTAAQAGEVAASVTDSDTAYADSIATELDEFVVEGRTQRVIKNGVEYMPDGKTKKMAHDATSLLEFMQIPQLSVSPENGQVTTAAGQQITSFINYVRVTENDLNGLRPEEVLRVEVLDHPDDPRFGGADHVINYILVKYDWGGYTKLTANGETLARDAASGTIYSKFVYKNWLFDVVGKASISKEDVESYSRETFKDIFFDNNHINEVERISSTPTPNCKKNNFQELILHALWNNENTSISHYIGINRLANPFTRNLSREEFSDNLLPSSEAVNEESQQSMGAAAQGDYFFTLSRKQSLHIMWNMYYASTRRNSTYQLADLTPIVADNREKTYVPWIEIEYTLPLGHNNKLGFRALSRVAIYHTGYSGTSQNSREDLSSTENILFATYSHQLSQKLRIFTRLGASYSYSDLNGSTIVNTLNPRFNFVTDYQINQSNSLSSELSWGNSYPSPSTTNDAIVQQNELMWVKGTRNLKNMLLPSVYVDYNFIPNNTFSFSSYIFYEGMLNACTFDYLSVPGYNGVVRTPTDNCDLHSIYLNLTGSARLLNRSLGIKVTLGTSHTSKTGVNSDRLTSLYAKTWITYFLGNFNFRLYYLSPQSFLSETKKEWRRSIYGLSVGYSTGNFTAEANFADWFNSNRMYTAVHSPHYDLYNWDTDRDLSRRISLTLTYTLPYGKKVSRDNELPTGSHINSAIMK